MDNFLRGEETFEKEHQSVASSIRVRAGDKKS
jgi:hypothetical protein